MAARTDHQHSSGTSLDRPDCIKKRYEPMSAPQDKLPWTQPGWREQAEAWVHAELTRRGIRVDGEIEQPHLRPWSTVLRVPTSAGDYFFKATSPLLAHEPALTQWL